MASINALIEAATERLGEFALGSPGASAGSVAAALVSADGNVYTGICVHVACGIGFCAEHAAVAEMLKHRELVVKAIVAVSLDGVVPPCGRCRELLVQVSSENLDARVALSSGRVAILKELLPERWSP